MSRRHRSIHSAKLVRDQSLDVFHHANLRKPLVQAIYILDSCRIPKGENIWSNSNDLAVLPVKLAERDMGISTPCDSETPVVRQRSQEGTLKLIEAFLITLENKINRSNSRQK